MAVCLESLSSASFLLERRVLESELDLVALEGIAAAFLLLGPAVDDGTTREAICFLAHSMHEHCVKMRETLFESDDAPSAS